MPSTATRAEMQKANDAKDYHFNWDMCVGKTRFPDDTTGNEGYDACKNAVSWAYDSGDTAYLKSICATPDDEYRLTSYGKSAKGAACERIEQGGAVKELADAPCAGLGAKVDAAFDADKFRLQQDFATVAKKLYTCGDYATLFGTLVGKTYAKGDTRIGVTILAGLQAGGANVVAALTDYLSMPKPSLRANLGEWLEREKNTAMCAPLAKALTAKDDVTETYALLFYFANSQCKEGIPLALGVLRSTDGGQREAACVNLARLGTKKEIPKIKIVADSDHYAVRLDNGAVHYPVRVACTGAVGSIQLRGD